MARLDAMSNDDFLCEYCGGFLRCSLLAPCLGLGCDFILNTNSVILSEYYKFTSQNDIKIAFV